MEWRDEGIILSVRKHGETSVIAEVFTSSHGRHAGVVRGGTSRKLKPVLQPGAQVQVDWSARLETHLGAFRVEPLRSRSVQVMGNRRALEGLNAVCALAGFCLGEREPAGGFYDLTIDLLDRIGEGEDWLADYARWEAVLLSDLGYGLDLDTCASTGQDTDLIYVSPNTGRAVSRGAGAPWADRLLPLPDFLRDGREQVSLPDVLEALRTTGHFFQSSVAPALGKENVPAARERFVTAIRRSAP